MNIRIDNRNRKKYIEGIDGLRAIAVIMVLLYHLRFNFAKGGLLGVTVFFVISGFLITQILRTELETTGNIDLREFWLKRIRRLYPAILTVTVVFIYISAVFNRVLFTKGSADMFSVIFGYNNWWQIFNDVSYFEKAGTPSPFTHCWSLAVEAQFYVIFPILLIFLSRVKNDSRLFAKVTLVLAVVSAALMTILYDPDLDPSRVYYGTDTRAFSLLFGAFLALTEDRIRKKISSSTSEIIGVVSLVGLIIMMVTVKGYTAFPYRGGQVLVSLLTALVILSFLDDRSLLGRLLSAKPLKWISDRSYGIYLWHYPIILLLSGGKRSAWWLILIEVVLTLIVSELSYRFIETPIRHGYIGDTLALIRNTSKTTRTTRMERGRRQQMRKARRGVHQFTAAVVLMFGCLLCVAFVPKEHSAVHVPTSQQEAEVMAEQPETEAAPPAEEETAAVPATEEELAENLNLLMIGDSIGLDIQNDLAALLPKCAADTKIGRYAVEGADLYNVHAHEYGWSGDGVIMVLALNGPMYDSMENMREAMGPDQPLFISNGRAPYVEWEQSNNEEIAEFAKNHKNTYLIDWYAYSEGHPEYFDQDETHLLPAGSKAYAKCIRDTVIDVFKNKK